MDNISTLLSSLGTSLQTQLSATVNFDQVLEKNIQDVPLIELNVVGIQRETFGITFISYTIQAIYYKKTVFDRLSFQSLQERLEMSKQIRDVLFSWWHIDNVGSGTLTNINSPNPDTFENGEYSTMSTKVSRVITQFTINLKDI